MEKTSCCIIALLALGLQVKAKTTVISGNAPSFAGKTIAVRTYSEQVLNEEEELGQATVASDGSFKFELETDRTLQVFIPTDVTKAFLYIEPGESYTISLPDYRERTIIEKLDPYFAPKDYLATIEGLRRGDFNYQMMEFEDAFDFYTIKHVTYGSQVDSLRKSVKELQNIFTDLKKPFQEKFKAYRYILLMNMCVGENQPMQDTVILQLNAIGTPSTMCSTSSLWDR